MIDVLKFLAAWFAVSVVGGVLFCKFICAGKGGKYEMD